MIFDLSHSKTIILLTMDSINDIPPRPKLRRSVAVVPKSQDDEMRRVDCDLHHSSNQDLVSATEGLRRHKFRHPRARQAAAAARYGFVFTHEEVFNHSWKDRLARQDE